MLLCSSSHLYNQKKALFSWWSSATPGKTSTCMKPATKQRSVRSLWLQTQNALLHEVMGWAGVSPDLPRATQKRTISLQKNLECVTGYFLPSNEACSWLCSSEEKPQVCAEQEAFLLRNARSRQNPRSTSVRITPYHHREASASCHPLRCEIYVEFCFYELFNSVIWELDLVMDSSHFTNVCSLYQTVNSLKASLQTFFKIKLQL